MFALSFLLFFVSVCTFTLALGEWFKVVDDDLTKLLRKTGAISRPAERKRRMNKYKLVGVWEASDLFKPKPPSRNLRGVEDKDDGSNAYGPYMLRALNQEASEYQKWINRFKSSGWMSHGARKLDENESESEIIDAPYYSGKSEEFYKEEPTEEPTKDGVVDDANDDFFPKTATEGPTQQPTQQPTEEATEEATEEETPCLCFSVTRTTVFTLPPRVLSQL